MFFEIANQTVRYYMHPCEIDYITKLVSEEINIRDLNSYVVNFIEKLITMSKLFT